MQYAHVKTLEKYHPGYKNRILLWAKIHIKMIQGDPDCEMITDETDWARLIKFILLELNAQKPIPLDPLYLQRKGFNLKKRPIALTLKMLHTFIDVVSTTDTECIPDVTYTRIDKNRIEESRVEDISLFWDYFLLKTQKKYILTDERKVLIQRRLLTHSLEDLNKAVDNFVADDWEGRADHLDLIYCIGKQKGKPDNLEKWLNIEAKSESGERLRPGTNIPEKYFNKE